MPRMPKYLKREWAFFLDERGRKKYNELCRKCERSCKQELPCRRYPMSALSIKKENKTMTDYLNNIPAKLEIIKASEITPKEVRWLWYPYIPFSKVHCCKATPETARVS